MGHGCGCQVSATFGFIKKGSFLCVSVNNIVWWPMRFLRVKKSYSATPLLIMYFSVIIIKRETHADYYKAS
jgi:hypothetical protein